MDAKRLAIGTVVGAIALYLTGYVIFDMLFGGFYEGNMVTDVSRESNIAWALGVGSVLYALLITLAVESRGEGNRIVNGAIAGAVVGFLLWGTVDFTLYAINNVTNLTIAIVDPFLEGVHAALAGAAIGAIPKR